MRRPTRPLRLLALLLPFWLAGPPASRAQADAAPAGAGERWFEMRIAGVPAGYVHETTDAGSAGAVRTSTESVIVLNRLETRVEISARAVETEDADGHLVAVHSEIRASKDPTVLDLAVAGGELSVTTEAGGRRYQRSEHEARVLLGPEGIRRLTAASLAAGEATFGYATFVAELGGVTQVTRRVTGGAAPHWAIEETVEALPSPARLLVGADGRVVEESVDGPFGEIRSVLATAAVRERAAGPLPEELYTRTLVRSNVRLPEPRAIERLRVRIDLKRPAGGFPELEGPYQHVLERAADHVVLEIRRAPALDGPPLVADANANAPFTQPNFILQSDHPDVAALARSLRLPGAGPYVQARLLQDWVAEHMRVDPGLAMLPASEVVRDRGGTCVAYAVLLTSLARALGIPARIVMGYVYVGNIWGGHAWSEVEVDGRWIPLDAAVYRPGPADATHLALVRHSAELGAASGAAELARLFGNESIRVLGYGRANHWTRVPADARPYVIDGNHYRNPWLGLEVDKPAAFAFSKADASYPDSTVIALAAADGSELRVRESGPRAADSDAREWLRAEGLGPGAGTLSVAGRPAWRGSAPGRAAIAFGDGQDLWMLDAEGPAAVAELDAVARGLVLRAAAR